MRALTRRLAKHVRKMCRAQTHRFRHFIETQLVLDLCMHQLRNPSQPCEAQSTSVRTDDRAEILYFRGVILSSKPLISAWDTGWTWRADTMKPKPPCKKLWT
jgi:hypothetical protein